MFSDCSPCAEVSEHGQLSALPLFVEESDMQSAIFDISPNAALFTDDEIHENIAITKDGDGCVADLTVLDEAPVTKTMMRASA